MRINDDHRHYGSALIQVAKDRHFTAINAFNYNGHSSTCGFRVNTEIGLYVRYRSKPQGKQVPIYAFNFTQENLLELRTMRKRSPRLFLALVCVKARQICCLPYSDFRELVEARKQEKGFEEQEYIVEVSIKPRKQFRVWISAPNEKGTYLLQRIIPRNDFPARIFN